MCACAIWCLTCVGGGRGPLRRRCVCHRRFFPWRPTGMQETRGHAPRARLGLRGTPGARLLAPSSGQHWLYFAGDDFRFAQRSQMGSRITHTTVEISRSSYHIVSYRIVSQHEFDTQSSMIVGGVFACCDCALDCHMRSRANT